MLMFIMAFVVFFTTTIILSVVGAIQPKFFWISVVILAASIILPIIALRFGVKMLVDLLGARYKMLFS